MIKEKHIPKIDFEKLPDTIGIVGSRSFSDSPVADTMIRNVVNKFVRSTREGTEIVSGGARGVDDYAAKAAKKYKRRLQVEWADEHIPSPQRYFERNEKIVRYVKERNGIILAFVDVTNMRGTTNTIRHAKRLGVPYLVYKFARYPLRPIGVDNNGTDVLYR